MYLPTPPNKLDAPSPMGVEHSGEGIVGLRSHNAKALRKN